MPTLQHLHWVRPISGSLLSFSLLAACGGIHSAQTVTASQNTYSRNRQEISLDDGCAPEKSPFASAVDWMNCVGAALGAPQSSNDGNSASFTYASRTKP